MSTPNLFIGVRPCGLSYCDRTREEHGDYKLIAFLSYSSLALDINDPASALLPAIRRHAAGIQAQRGRPFRTSTTGQTVILGQK